MPATLRLYLESTIPSYLAAQPSRDLIVAAHQQLTHMWWQRARPGFEMYISEAVLEEIGAGDTEVATRRLAFVSGLPILTITDEVAQLAEVYLRRLGLPAKAQLDSVHLACAVVYELDYLLTWNCTHLANGLLIQRLQGLHQELARVTPIILTPEELLEVP